MIRNNERLPSLSLVAMLLFWSCLLSVSCQAAQGDQGATQKTFHQNGKLKSETVHNPDGSILSKHYFDNGQLQIESYANPLDGSIHIKQYNREGVLLSEQKKTAGGSVKTEYHCTNSMEQIFVRWMSGPGELTAKESRFRGINISDEELALLKDANITGELEIVGSSGLSGECHASRVVFIFQDLVRKQVSLSLPKQTVLIYFQHEDGWRRFPQDAPILSRQIVFDPPKDESSRFMTHMSERESGAKSGGSVHFFR